MNRVQSADIFCRVIDNFGDAGVCWRLSREMARAGLSVTLWVDDLARLQRLRPQLVLEQPEQMLDGFRVRLWDDAAPLGYHPAQLVIEAFACRMPDAMLERMAQTHPRPAWINLDYLTAESWARDTHGLPSPHPRLPLTQYFFFPGFAPGSGGLLREADIATRHAALDVQGREAFLARAGVSVPRDTLLVSLFCYPQAPLEALLDAMRLGPRVLCLIPEGVTNETISRLIGTEAVPGTVRTFDQMTLRVIPFSSPMITTVCCAAAT